MLGRRAIAEYSDDLDGLFDESGERVSGHYTQVEYDDINQSSGHNDDY